MRRRREIVHRADGTPVKVAGRPRADVLHYPAANLTTVLVRRTHDVDAARALAETRWAELRAEGLVDQRLGTDARCVRVGWWTTRGGQPGWGSAIDHLRRVVTPCADTDWAAGPGVEFRP